jgi:CheY-like chemotaxis protein/glycine cleavage system H lipoate-binding protein
MSDPVTVLVVDDEQVVLDGVGRHLKRDGYEVESALSAADALDILAARKIDVLISDLMMPGMDGLELLDRISKGEKPPPLIMITGYATMRTALQALRKGAFDYIAKPFTRAELLGVVARAARRSVMASGAGEGPPEDYRGYGHCWIRTLGDGTARIGLDREFADTVGVPEELEMPQTGDFLEQGSACLKLLSEDGKTHVLWTPVSGTVVEVNPVAVNDPAKAVSDPYGEGWLLRIESGSLEEELSGLAE